MCHKPGHFKPDCLKRKKKGSKKQQDSGDADVPSVGYESFGNYEVLAISDKKSNNEWVLNSRCSFHMTPNEAWFSTITKIEGGKVLLGNNKECAVTGVRDISLKLDDGTVRTLKNVRLVLEFKEESHFSGYV